MNYNYSIENFPTYTDPSENGRKKAIIVLIILGFLFFIAGLGLLILEFSIGETYYQIAIPGLICTFLAMLFIIIAICLKKAIVPAIAVILIFILGITWFALIIESGIGPEMYEIVFENREQKEKDALKSAFNYANCQYPWAAHGTDFTYIRIDTNPYDTSSYTGGASMYSTDALKAIKDINYKLGIDSSLYSDMYAAYSSYEVRYGHYTSEKAYVSWSYNAGKGLEVVYYIKNWN